MFVSCLFSTSDNRSFYCESTSLTIFTDRITPCGIWSHIARIEDKGFDHLTNSSSKSSIIALSASVKKTIILLNLLYLHIDTEAVIIIKSKTFTSKESVRSQEMYGG